MASDIAQVKYSSQAMIAGDCCLGLQCREMPRPVPPETATRRRERLAALIEALGVARGAKVTQREFAASISREQGTIAAILGGHRALGNDVMLAVVHAYALPVDYFDAPLRPDPRSFARRAVGGPMSALPASASRGAVRASAPGPSYGSADPALGEVLGMLQPDRAVGMALEALSRQGIRHESPAWTRLAIAAQSAHDRGDLMGWYDLAVASAHAVEPAPTPARRVAVGEAPAPRLARATPKSSGERGR